MSEETGAMTSKEMFEFLVESCMKEHDMSKEEAEKYVNENVSQQNMKEIVFQANTLILMGRDNPGIIDGMMEKMKDMT